MSSSAVEPKEHALLAEYKMCESIVQHLDRINASYQSIFLAGSLAALGFILQNPSFPKLVGLTATSFVVLIGLLHLIDRSVQLRQPCYDRMKKIEDTLGLHLQHELQEKAKKGTRQLRIYSRIIWGYLLILLLLTIYSLFRPV